ncbi:hypothetical protein [Bacillus sp. UNCCL13]|uniref:hypothetical protein n=1 Tax=Bacillus sp. UNCCL13 TaxID=1502772 RepID=UPI000B869725|nr:hypothetical protein [Bacillus sp. UNCCL13]
MEVKNHLYFNLAKTDRNLAKGASYLAKNKLNLAKDASYLAKPLFRSPKTQKKDSSRHGLESFLI